MPEERSPQGDLIEQCLECPAVIATQAEADAHYALTGHVLGYPLDEMPQWLDLDDLPYCGGGVMGRQR